MGSTNWTVAHVPITRQPDLITPCENREKPLAKNAGRASGRSGAFWLRGGMVTLPMNPDLKLRGTRLAVPPLPMRDSAPFDISNLGHRGH